jgi:site-specific DNA-methyltransferase (adenine-specific)
MKEVPDKYFDLCICDPPYGHGKEIIGNNRSHNKLAISKNYGKGLFNNICPDKLYFDELTRISKNQIIWGINYYPFYFGSGRNIWDKQNGNNDFSDCEIAYNSMINSVRIFRYKWHGMLQENMKEKEIRIHPTQKPIHLYRWLLQNYAKPGDKIFDSHVGSASSLIACHLEGFEYIGCEKDEDYFEDANKRMQIHLNTQYRKFI